jgi:hypothetical protein
MSEKVQSLTRLGESEHVAVTVHAIADFDSEDGQTLLKEILTSMVSYPPATSCDLPSHEPSE